jgi:hypothetical protein
MSLGKQQNLNKPSNLPIITPCSGLIASINTKVAEALGEVLLKGLKAVYNHAHYLARKGKITQEMLEVFNKSHRHLTSQIRKVVSNGASEFDTAKKIVQKVVTHYNNPNGLVKAMKPSTDEYMKIVRRDSFLKAERAKSVTKYGEESVRVKNISQQMEENWSNFQQMEQQIRGEYEIVYNMTVSGHPELSLPADLNAFFINLRQAAKKISAVNGFKTFEQLTNSSTNTSKTSLKLA